MIAGCCRAATSVHGPAHHVPLTDVNHIYSLLLMQFNFWTKESTMVGTSVKFDTCMAIGTMNQHPQLQLMCYDSCLSKLSDEYGICS